MIRNNEVSDFQLYYNAQKYIDIEKYLQAETKVYYLHFLLALIGVTNNKKISLELNKSKGNIDEVKREFSIRTLYYKYRSEMDSHYALITILDNLGDDYENVIDNLAFEVTSTNGKKFYEMTNIKTFYESMLAGIEILHDDLFVYDKKYSNISDVLNDILNSSIPENDLVIDIIVEDILS